MAQRRGRRGRYRLLTPTERAAIEARFRAGAWVREVMAEFGVPHTSASHSERSGTNAWASGLFAAPVVV